MPACTFLLSALAGQFYKEDTTFFWVYAVFAIAVGAFVVYFSERSIMVAIRDVDEHVAGKMAEITKQFDEKIHDLQSQIKDLKASADKK